MTLMFDVRPHSQPATEQDRAAVLANPGFGTTFSDHMAVATWTRSDGWHDSAVVPYGPFSLQPAAGVFHYGQEIFEGLKAYRHADGSIWTFRPDMNAARFVKSAHRLGLPEFPIGDFIGSVDALVSADRNWVPEPGDGEASLYLRPFMFASEAFLGVRAAEHVTYCCIASPAGAYFPTGVKPVGIWVTSQYSRAGAGGTGAAKCGGNYASSLLAQQEATTHGCSQVLFADAGTHRFVEELGGMNVFFVNKEGELVTPALSGSILEGVTRGSILGLAADRGLVATERPVEMTELFDGIRSGDIKEVFACGTAAVITPIGWFLTEDGERYEVGDGGVGQHTQAMRTHLLDVQYGRAEDTHGWMHRVC
ncbi:branched-chain amino acid aminotransferase [Mariniluteicoccus flavus]